MTESPRTPSSTSSANIETTALRTELSSMNQQLQEKNEELARLRAKQMVHTLPSENKKQVSLSMREDLESERIALSELLASLEDRYSSGEISIFEYSRLYKKYTKELYTIRKQLEYLG
jgi:hypothetical protein